MSRRMKRGVRSIEEAGDGKRLDDSSAPIAMCESIICDSGDSRRFARSLEEQENAPQKRGSQMSQNCCDRNAGLE